uniref:SFRICE_022389 n=1 Tax=Spodoptera frugiperda TaxID=7108 RepID=A0A2H1VCF2_SPOFR
MVKSGCTLYSDITCRNILNKNVVSYLTHISDPTDDVIIMWYELQKATLRPAISNTHNRKKNKFTSQTEIIRRTSISISIWTASMVDWSQLRQVRARGLGFDSWVGQSTAGLFSVFRKFLSSSTKSGIVPNSVIPKQ